MKDSPPRAITQGKMDVNIHTFKSVMPLTQNHLYSQLYLARDKMKLLRISGNSKFTGSTSWSIICLAFSMDYGA